MQKLDFVQKVNSITYILKSADIVSFFESGFYSNQLQGVYDYTRIIPKLFESKSAYDVLFSKNEYEDILLSLGSNGVYNNNYLGEITKDLQLQSTLNVLTYSSITDFYIFHKQLLYLSRTLKGVFNLEDLTNEEIELSEKGITIFQISNDEKGLSIELYIKILNTLKELVEKLSQLLDEEYKCDLILLDSGSDTNLGIQTSVKVAGSLFSIFKEVWDLIVNFKYYKQKQQNQMILDNLTVISEIKKLIDNGALSEEKGKEYTHIIKTRLDTLIGLKVLPKEIIDTDLNNKDSNRNILNEYHQTKYLKESND